MRQEYTQTRPPCRFQSVNCSPPSKESGILSLASRRYNTDVGYERVVRPLLRVLELLHLGLRLKDVQPCRRPIPRKQRRVSFVPAPIACAFDLGLYKCRRQTRPNQQVCQEMCKAILSRSRHWPMAAKLERRPDRTIHRIPGRTHMARVDHSPKNLQCTHAGRLPGSTSHLQHERWIMGGFVFMMSTVGGFAKGPVQTVGRSATPQQITTPPAIVSSRVVSLAISWTMDKHGDALGFRNYRKDLEGSYLFARARSKG